MSARLPGRPRHLAHRFFESLRRREPDPDEEAALVDLLRPVELELYETLSRPDRRHAVTSATAAARLLGRHRTDALVVAASLHDVGKVDAGLGTLGRVMATVVGGVLGRARLDRMGRRWSVAARWATYADHAALGAAKLERAAAAPEVVAWAREHHGPPGESTLGVEVAEVLARADGD